MQVDIWYDFIEIVCVVKNVGVKLSCMGVWFYDWWIVFVLGFVDLGLGIVLIVYVFFFLNMFVYRLFFGDIIVKCCEG